MTLTEFLLERIAEDEAPTFELVPYACEPGCCAPVGWVGRRCVICDLVPVYGGTVEAITEMAQEHDEQIHRRSRVLAECEAKRRIVDYREQATGGSRQTGLPIFEAQVSAYDATLRALALPYADHPDYDEEWKP